MVSANIAALCAVCSVVEPGDSYIVNKIPV